MHDRGEVIQADITEIMQLSKFFNLKLKIIKIKKD